MRILITSGGTKVPIDSVRHIGNMSSGTMGYNIAESALKRKHSVDFLSSKDGKRLSVFNTDLLSDIPRQYNEMDRIRNLIRNSKYDEFLYSTFQQYHSYLEYAVKKNNYDAIILCAAVSDYLTIPSDGKISSDKDNLQLNLVKAPKVIKSVSELAKQSTKIVGFKMLSGCTLDELEDICYDQLNKYNLSMVVGNDIEALRSGKYYQLHVTENKVKLIKENFSDTIIKAIEGL